MVELVDLHKRLGAQEVLRGVSLSVRRAECVVILGLSGTGKSVTLKHIVGLMRPDAGLVRIDGHDLGQRDAGRLRELRERIGYLFQNGALLGSLTVYENVALPMREHEELSEEQVGNRVREALRRVDLAGAEGKMPGHLSGGECKRVALARALIREPRILLYDEPTAGLDPRAADRIGALIKQMQVDLRVTSIVVTHDLALAFRVADRMAMLHEGRIVEEGRPIEFRHSSHPLVRGFLDAIPGAPEPPIVFESGEEP